MKLLTDNNEINKGIQSKHQNYKQELLQFSSKSKKKSLLNDNGDSWKFFNIQASKLQVIFFPISFCPKNDKNAKIFERILG